LGQLRAIYSFFINRNLTVVIFRPRRALGKLCLDRTGGLGQGLGAMPNVRKTKRLFWPWWAPWAMLAVAATSVLTIAATLYDIL
jgi:hypothetical protein